MSAHSRVIEQGASVCAGLDITTKAGIETALLRGQDSDELLYSVLFFLRQQSPATRRLTETVFSDIASFFTDSNVPELSVLARRILNKGNGQSERERMLAERNGDLTGVELGNASGTQFVVFLPDASVPGAFRYSNFDESGFFAHATFKTYGEALEAAWGNGYRVESAGALNRLCLTDRWAAGSKVTLLIQQVNLGKISHEEYIKALAA